MAKFWISRNRPFVLKERIHGYRAGQALVSLFMRILSCLRRQLRGREWKERSHLAACEKPGQISPVKEKNPPRYTLYTWPFADRHKGKIDPEWKESDSSIIDMLSGSFIQLKHPINLFDFVQKKRAKRIAQHSLVRPLRLFTWYGKSA